jgi:hypothetical protein
LVTLPHCLPLPILPQGGLQAENVFNSPHRYEINGSFKKINSIEFFRKGIEPKWEDEQNQKGGRFIFQVPKNQQNKKEIY